MPEKRQRVEKDEKNNKTGANVVYYTDLLRLFYRYIGRIAENVKIE